MGSRERGNAAGATCFECFTEGDPTLQACWDAEHLDLGRVATSDHRPTAVLATWGWG